MAKQELNEILETKILKKQAKNQLRAVIQLILVQFNIFGQSEVEVMYQVYIYNSGTPVNISAKVRKELRERCKIGESAFGVAMYRLAQKSVITRKQKSVFFHPAFSNLDDVNCVVFKIEKQDVREQA